MSLEGTPVSFTAADGIELAASEWRGDADESHPVVVLLHGGGQTRHSWKRAGSTLAAAGFDAVALDCRGHGDSDWSPDGEYLYSQMTSDVVGVVAKLARPVVLVGASMGGLVSLLVAAELGDELAAVVLVDVVPRVEKAGGDRVKDFMRSGSGGFDTLEDAADAIAAYLPHRTKPRSPEGLRRNLRQKADGRWYWHWDPKFLEPSALRATERIKGFEDAAAGITVPMLLLHGAKSDVVSQDGIDHLLAIVPTARVGTMPTAAHTAAGDDNNAFSAAVVDFIRELA